MNCAYDVCLYNSNFKCTLDGININVLGHCDDCVRVSIDNEVLAAEKERQLSKIEEKQE